MNFLLIITNMAGGGAEKAFTKLSETLIVQGHQVSLVLFEDNISQEISSEVDLSILQKNGKKVPNAYRGKRFLARKLRKLYTSLNKKNLIDVTISTLPFADEITHLAKIPNARHRIADTLSLEVSEFIAAGRNNKAARRKRRYQAIYSGKNLIAVSEGVKSDLIENIGIKQANIDVIHNIYDFDKTRVLAKVENNQIPTEHYVIHVGRFSPQKRHDLLLKAYQGIKTTHKLVLLTEDSEPLRQLINREGLHDEVVVAGFQSNPYNWISKAELLILCSDHEGLPNVLVEALICGTKIVSTDCPSGPSEIIGDHSSSLLVPVNDPMSLSKAIIEALSNPLQIPTEFNDKFSKDQTLKKYEALKKSP